LSKEKRPNRTVNVPHRSLANVSSRACTASADVVAMNGSTVTA